MSVQNLKEITSFGKENVDALLQSSTLAVKGLEELARHYSKIANQSIEQTQAAVKSLTGAKDPNEFQAAYAALAKANFDNFVAESRKLQEMANDIMSKSFAPLNARIEALSSLFKPN